jgi:GDP/UDP-N,N'-diacetylbacillosamine 2-epimerase (hydrolysing)
MVIGNSSSGIIEAPSFHIPTINIGDRQKGRLQAESVINCEPTIKGINAAIALANSLSFREIAKNVLNPYGDGNTSSKVLEQIDKMLEGIVDLKKSFYDISFEI